MKKESENIFLVLVNKLQILPSWLFLFLFASFEIHRRLLFLFVQKLPPQIYSYLPESKLFAEYCGLVARFCISFCTKPFMNQHLLSLKEVQLHSEITLLMRSWGGTKKRSQGNVLDFSVFFSLRFKFYLKKVMSGGQKKHSNQSGIR